MSLYFDPNVAERHAKELHVHREELQAQARKLGILFDVPKGAQKLGCANCRIGARFHTGDPTDLYCSGCPVTRRQKDKRVKRELKDTKECDVIVTPKDCSI